MTDTLNIQDKSIVVPGEMIATGMGFVPSKGTYRDGDHVYSSRLGLVTLEGKVIKLIPLSGVYLPKVGDIIIAKVIDVMLSGWRLETFCPYSSVLTLMEATSEYIPKKTDLTRYFDIGDFVITEVSNVTSQNLVDVSMKGPGLKKLRGGRVVMINPHKVPRLIGKRGSMVQMIKDTTECRILVGQNGVVWIEGEPENEIVAVEAVKIVEELAHISGLTERIKQHLESQKNRIVHDPNRKMEEDDIHYGMDEEGSGEHSHAAPRRQFDHRGPSRGPPRTGMRPGMRSRPQNEGSTFKEEPL